MYLLRHRFSKNADVGGGTRPDDEIALSLLRARADGAQILLPEHDHASATDDGPVSADDTIAAQLDAVPGEVASRKLRPRHPVHGKVGEVVQLIERNGIRAGRRRRELDKLVRESIEIADDRSLGGQVGDVGGGEAGSADRNIPVRIACEGSVRKVVGIRSGIISNKLLYHIMRRDQIADRWVL